MKLIIGVVIAVIFAAQAPTQIAFAQKVPQASEKKKFNFSQTPAVDWQDALVSGNGKMGIMVHGNPHNESIVLNHELLYEFIGTEAIAPVDISDSIPQVKQMIKAGKYSEAHKFLLDRAFEKGHPDILWTDPYHPACSMKINQEFEGAIEDYRRATCYTNGEISVAWKADGIQYRRNSIVSRPSDVIAMRIEASQTAAINITVSLEDQLKELSEAQKKVHSTLGIVKNIGKLFPERKSEFNELLVEPTKKTALGSWLTFRVKYQVNDRGYEVVTQIRNIGGTLSQLDDKIVVHKADAVEILTGILPLEDYAKSEIETAKQRLANLGDYKDLSAQHSSVHSAMFNRVTLELDKTGFSDDCNEALILRQKDSAKVDPYLLEKVFNMGVYGLISSSGDNPPNLMGIWNGEWRPSWSGDFTLDANVNLQISAANLANQPEAIDSYMKMLERVAPDWEVNAKHLFGCRGYASGLRTSGRRNLNTHFGTWPGNHWTSGAGWLLSPCYEYYLCSGDREFLEKRLMPMMEKTALFYEDFLDTFDDDGKFLIVPSYSPENKPGNIKPRTGVSANATMDIAVIRELMTNLIAGSKELGGNVEKIKKWESILAKLPPYLVNDDGALKEWAHPKLEDYYNHRHVSHLYLAWPSLELTPDDAKLLAAAKIAMTKRGRGNGSAHGLAHSALIGARLKQPNLVYGNLLFLLTEDYLYSSLFTSHNPGRIFNSDALHSIPAIVLEMLVYSRPGEIELMPACSEALAKGKVTGVMCRTWAKVDSMEWDFPKGELKATITSRKAQRIRLRLRKDILSVVVDGVSHDAVDGSIELEFKPSQSRAIKIKWQATN